MEVFLLKVLPGGGAVVALIILVRFMITSFMRAIALREEQHLATVKTHELVTTQLLDRHYLQISDLHANHALVIKTISDQNAKSLKMFDNRLETLAEQARQDRGAFQLQINEVTRDVTLAVKSLEEAVNSLRTK